MAYQSPVRSGGLGPGILAASVAAGPVFLAMAALGAWQSTPAAVAVSAWPLLLIVPIVMMSMVVGSLVAVLPVAIGSHAMAWAARRNAGLAHPAAWAIAGGLAAGGWIPFVATSFEDVAIFAFAATGAVCASICRARIVVGD